MENGKWKMEFVAGKVRRGEDGVMEWWSNGVED
jgi:hypothetical protein